MEIGSREEAEDNGKRELESSRRLSQNQYEDQEEVHLSGDDLIGEVQVIQSEVGIDFEPGPRDQKQVLHKPVPGTPPSGLSYH